MPGHENPESQDGNGNDRGIGDRDTMKSIITAVKGRSAEDAAGTDHTDRLISSVQGMIDFLNMTFLDHPDGFGLILFLKNSFPPLVISLDQLAFDFLKFVKRCTLKEVHAGK
jgi:hypothetical protein